MDIEHGALCQIIADGDMESAIDLHITGKFFEDPANLRVWDMLLDHWKTYGVVPDFDTVHAAYPTWTPYTYTEPLRYFLDQLRDRLKYRVTMTAVTDAFAVTEEGGPLVGERFISAIRQGIANAISEVPSGKDVDYFTNFDSGTMSRITDRVANPGIRGVTTGFPSLDQITGGYQKGQLITLVAVPKTGKSTLSLFSALKARESGIRTLYFTFEMSAEEQEDRLASLVSGVSLRSILDGDLSTSELDRLTRSHALRAYSHQGLTIVADTASVTTISDVQAKIRHYQPQLVFIDGMYLMDDENGEDRGSPQALTNITRSTKRMAQAENIPIVATTQGLLARSKGGVNMSSAAYSSSFAQDSDVLLGADKLGNGISKFSVLAARSARTGGFYLQIDWDQGMIQELPEAEAEIILSMPEPTVAQSGGGFQSFMMED